MTPGHPIIHLAGQNGMYVFASVFGFAPVNPHAGHLGLVQSQQRKVFFEFQAAGAMG